MTSAVPDSSPATAPAVKPISCPNCGAPIEIKAAGYTVTLVCPYCSSVLDVADPDVKIVKRYNEAVAELDIPLGARGLLRGVEWEVIGYLRKSENGTYPWEEYLLFNPYAGYRWLVTDGRGWTLGTMLTASPRPAGGRLAVDGKNFTPFFRNGRSQVDYVLGEFYWRVKVGEEARTADYVRPGFMLSYEANASEESWTVGELLDPKEMQAAFGVEPPPRWPRTGRPPMPHQPSPYGAAASAVTKLGLVAAAALLVIAILFGGTGQRQSFDMTIVPGAGGRSATFGPVRFTRPTQGVTIEARAPTLSNAWVDLDYMLVDRRTQTAYQAYAIAERYSGRDSDGDWTEGSRGATTKLATVPAGDYDLVVEASGSNWGVGSMSEIPVTISIAQGATFFSNIILALIALAIPAIWTVSRHISFEAARQGDSDDAQARAEAGDDE